MRAVMIAVLLLAAVGCGPEEGRPPPPIPDAGTGTGGGGLPVSFAAGRWTGNAQLAVSVSGTETIASVVSIPVASEFLVHVDAVCPGGGGSFAVSPRDDRSRAVWRGPIVCPHPTATCPEEELWLTETSVFMQDIDTLRVDAEGALVGCGASRGLSFVFTGQK
jgi:hypothetical protein